MTQDKTSSRNASESLPSLALRVEHQREAFGIGTDSPRLSWIVETAGNEWHQAGYEIESYAVGGRLLNQTGRVNSDQSALVAWPFEPLSSRERVTVRARAWSTDGQTSDWSERVPIEVGLLQTLDWSARFIGPAWDEDLSQPQPAPLLLR